MNLGAAYDICGFKKANEGIEPNLLTSVFQLSTGSAIGDRI